MRINDDALKQYSKTDGYTKKGSLTYKTTKSEDIKERWFVLKGNLLFYFKILNNYPFKTEQEPTGVLVVEDCSAKLESSTYSQASFSITFKGEPRFYFYGSKTDCQEWVSVITLANMQTIKTQLQVLRTEIMKRTGQDPLKRILDTRLMEISKKKAIGKSMFVRSAIVSQPVPGEVSSSTLASAQQSSTVARNEPRQTYRPPMILSTGKAPQPSVQSASSGVSSTTAATPSVLLPDFAPASAAPSQSQGHSLIQWDLIEEPNDASIAELFGIDLGNSRSTSDTSYWPADKPATHQSNPEFAKFQGWENFE